MGNFHYFNITYDCDSDCKFCAANIGLIEGRNYTMSAYSFEQALIKENVQPQDHVMISGGEPTLSKYFWDILEVCKKYKCIIDLTTNGHFFSVKENVDRIKLFPFVILRIPIFGFEEQHDYLTGHAGGFKKVISSLDNLKPLLHSGSFIVNVKFLLSKATAQSNESVYQWLINRYGYAFEYTLSPLLVSKKVILHKELLLTTYTKMIDACLDFVNDDYLNCDIIPLCVLPEKKRNSILNRRLPHFEKTYNDAQHQKSNIDNYGCNLCQECLFASSCDKFLPSYIEYFGESEIRPFK